MNPPLHVSASADANGTVTLKLGGKVVSRREFAFVAGRHLGKLPYCSIAVEPSFQAAAALQRLLAGPCSA